MYGLHPYCIAIYMFNIVACMYVYCRIYKVQYCLCIYQFMVFIQHLSRNNWLLNSREDVLADSLISSLVFASQKERALHFVIRNDPNSGVCILGGYFMVYLKDWHSCAPNRINVLIQIHCCFLFPQNNKSRMPRPGAASRHQ